MKNWLIWLLIRDAVVALIDIVFIHDTEAAIAFWVVCSMLDAESTLEQNTRRKELHGASP